MGLHIQDRIHKKEPIFIQKIVVKISGELFSSEKEKSISQKSLDFLIDFFEEILSYRCSLAIVVGGGNIMRGREIHKECNFSKTSSDTIGMYATLINGLVLRESFLQRGIDSLCFAPSNLIGMRLGDHHASLLSYDIPVVQNYFVEGKAVILAGGTGNSFFTTDTATVLRALELNADLVVKATKVNGIYSSDPMKGDKNLIRYEAITFDELLTKRLQVMDQTAFILAKEHRLPLYIYQYGVPYSLIDAMQNSTYGTLVMP